MDVVISTMVHNINEQEDLKIFPKKWNQKMANVTAACEMFERNYFGWELAGKVYKKGVLLELSLDKTVTDAEDLDANWQILSKARNVYCCSDMIYHYRLHPSSKIHSNNLRAGYESMFKVAQHLMSNIWTNDSRVADKLFRFYMRCAYNVGREEVFNGDNLYLLKKMKNDVRQCMSEFAIDDIKEMEFMKLWAIDEHLFYEKINTVLHKIEEKFKKNNSSNVYFYGNGLAGKYIARMADRLGIAYNGWVISDGQKKEPIFWDHPVVYVSDYQQKSDAVLFLTVGSAAKKEIVPLLQRKGLKFVDLNMEKIIF